MRGLWIACCLLGVGQVHAETVISARAIRANAVVTEADVTITQSPVPGAFSNLADVIGLEAKTAIYPGRPIRPADLRPPAIIERNETIPLIFRSGELFIQTEGRALGRGARGDVIRVMNLSSRKTVMGQILGDGAVVVE